MNDKTPPTTDDELMELTMADTTANDLAFAAAASMALTRQSQSKCESIPLCEQVFQVIWHLDQARFALNTVGHIIRDTGVESMTFDDLGIEATGLDLRSFTVELMTRLGVLGANLMDAGLVESFKEDEPEKPKFTLHKGGRA